jgi:hypothetical protein
MHSEHSKYNSKKNIGQVHNIIKGARDASASQAPSRAPSRVLLPSRLLPSQPSCPLLRTLRYGVGLCDDGGWRLFVMVGDDGPYKGTRLSVNY